MEDKLKKVLEDVKPLKILKKDRRSYVFTFEFEGKVYVYKEPIEKNTRKWQKFLAIFRGSESKREFKRMRKIYSQGFKTVTPIFYTNDYIVYEFIKGHKPNICEIDLVVKELDKIHSKGYLHGDSHLDNFIISEQGEVYIIDSKFQKNKFGKFGAIFEMMFLENSLNIEIDYDKESIYYKGAVLLRKYLTAYSKFKNIIRRR